MILLLLLSRFSRVQLCVTPETAAHQAPRPWDSPGKNTGVGCRFLLQCMKVKVKLVIVATCQKLDRYMLVCTGLGSTQMEHFLSCREFSGVAQL